MCVGAYGPTNMRTPTHTNNLQTLKTYNISAIYCIYQCSRHQRGKGITQEPLYTSPLKMHVVAPHKKYLSETSSTRVTHVNISLLKIPVNRTITRESPRHTLPIWGTAIYQSTAKEFWLKNWYITNLDTHVRKCTRTKLTPTPTHTNKVTMLSIHAWIFIYIIQYQWPRW